VKVCSAWIIESKKKNKSAKKKNKEKATKDFFLRLYKNAFRNKKRENNRLSLLEVQ
jgi:hypothetical protein